MMLDGWRSDDMLSRCAASTAVERAHMTRTGVPALEIGCERTGDGSKVSGLAELSSTRPLTP